MFFSPVLTPDNPQTMTETTTYTATITITGIAFTPLSGPIASPPYTGAELTLLPSPPDQPPGIFTGDGESIVVAAPADFTGSIVIQFTLDDPNHTLLGLVFLPSDNHTGVSEFPSISLSRSQGKSVLSVTDDYLKADDDITFDYRILVQRLSTGDIGAIDPKIRSGIN